MMLARQMTMGDLRRFVQENPQIDNETCLYVSADDPMPEDNVGFPLTRMVHDTDGQSPGVVYAFVSCPDPRAIGGGEW